MRARQQRLNKVVFLAFNFLVLSLYVFTQRININIFLSLQEGKKIE
jgi:hypothetical protein